MLSKKQTIKTNKKDVAKKGLSKVSSKKAEKIKKAKLKKKSVKGLSSSSNKVKSKKKSVIKKKLSAKSAVPEQIKKKDVKSVKNKKTAIKKLVNKVNKKIKSEKNKEIWTVGKRKTSIARVHFFSQGKGEIFINGKTIKHYFSMFDLRKSVVAPIALLKQDKKFIFNIKVYGGGIKGQSEAARLGIARALVMFNPLWRKALRAAGFLCRDSRKKERKKPGLKRARRAPQWQKR